MCVCVCVCVGVWYQGPITDEERAQRREAFLAAKVGFVFGCLGLGFRGYLDSGLGIRVSGYMLEGFGLR